MKFSKQKSGQVHAICLQKEIFKNCLIKQHTGMQAQCCQIITFISFYQASSPLLLLLLFKVWERHCIGKKIQYKFYMKC